MSTHDAENFIKHRHARCIPEHDPFSARNPLQWAVEPHRVEQLPWPRNQFGEPASIAELLDEVSQLSRQAVGNPNIVCSCGCGRAHNNNVSQTLRNPYGRGFEVVYFWSEACKSTWNREGMRNPVSAF